MVPSLPDHDFNNFWGSVLGVADLQSRPMANSLIKQYWDDPIQTGRQFSRILAQYTDQFEQVSISFFGGTLPISFHGHVTDAMCPTTVASLLLRLAIISKSDSPDSIHDSSPVDRTQLASLLGWTERHFESPRWVAVEDSFAAGFGPLVSDPEQGFKVRLCAQVPRAEPVFLQANLSAQPAFRAHAAGSPSISIRLVDRSPADLVHALSHAKQLGCIGVIVEIVNNQLHGRVTTPEQLRNLMDACKQTGLMLVIDETITAVRCGAPFAHQRPEYRAVGKPDLVFFGKGLGANGIGINFDGPYLQRLGIDAASKRRQAIHDWQAVVTQALHLPVLIEALGILEMATAGDWVGRAQTIGRHLRRIAMTRAETLKRDRDPSGDPDPVLGGLDSFIFIRKDIAATFLVMGASNAGPWVRWVRWMPRMDRRLTKTSTIESLTSVSAKSRELRKYMSLCLEKEGLKPQWCFYCGNSAGRDSGIPWCKTCCIDVCREDECIEHLLAHQCPGSGSDVSSPCRGSRP
ncbi:hypothetical protein A1O3_00771 [Capronia epimyces CBS 606.96]|uniref:Uncharacterized protein n=1 Tax=Capronia epimyces CBS 606.96 TaxID=1182542 RepID=W9YSH7_9EURO|nr:uncharacterized protein A1O3_00771 [Capronia epimyces CBS 606.96]EXJ92221.1 hypothetical protein A1O3_00771 [Capronia epimyces CBS 606.96]